MAPLPSYKARTMSTLPGGTTAERRNTATHFIQEMERVVERVREVYHKIAKLESLKPSENVDSVFGELVRICIDGAAADMDMEALSESDRLMREHLIRLCAEAEGHMERHYAAQLARRPRPCSPTTLTQFPYYANYLALANMEVAALQSCAGVVAPSKICFVGSGPLPLSVIVMATQHYPLAAFHNYDCDGGANAAALRLVTAHPRLAARIHFHTKAAEEVGPHEEALAACDVVFVAALVGMDLDAKAAVLRQLRRCAKASATFVIRSARGGRAFLYPVVEPQLCRELGFRVLSVVHPNDDVINSVIVATIPPNPQTQS